jgi:hypothetical protein
VVERRKQLVDDVDVPRFRQQDELQLHNLSGGLPEYSSATA